MATKKKTAETPAGGRRTGRTKDAPRRKEPATRPQHSEAYEATLREYIEALSLLHKHDYHGALERFQAIAATNVDEPELVERARTFASLCARKTAAPPPEPVGADECYYLGVVRANERRIEEALRLLDRALELEPASPRVLYARASARALGGEAAAAVADLRKAISADPQLRFQAANDPDFEKIRDEAAFIDVIEPTPTGA